MKIDCHSKYNRIFYVVAVLLYAVHLFAHAIPALFIFAGFSPGFEGILYQIAEGPIGLLFAFSIIPLIVWDIYVHRRHHIDIHAKEHKIAELEKKLGIRKSGDPDCTHEHMHKD